MLYENGRIVGSLRTYISIVCVFFCVCMRPHPASKNIQQIAGLNCYTLNSASHHRRWEKEEILHFFSQWKKKLSQNVTSPPLLPMHTTKNDHLLHAQYTKQQYIYKKKTTTTTFIRSTHTFYACFVCSLILGSPGCWIRYGCYKNNCANLILSDRANKRTNLLLVIFGEISFIVSEMYFPKCDDYGSVTEQYTTTSANGMRVRVCIVWKLVEEMNIFVGTYWDETLYRNSLCFLKWDANLLTLSSVAMNWLQRTRKRDENSSYWWRWS